MEQNICGAITQPLMRKIDLLMSELKKIIKNPNDERLC